MSLKIIFQTFKKLSAVSLILVLVLASLVGCGEAAEKAPLPSAEPIAAQSPSEENATHSSEGAEPGNESSPDEGLPAEPTNQGDLNNPDQSDTASAPQNAFAPQSDSELDGTVKTTGTDSFVVSQSFTMPSENSESSEIMVAPAEGSEDEVLITVHTPGDTAYFIHTVKNGGKNGDSDVEKTDAGFGDIQEKVSVNAKGHYEDGDFWADSIIIYRFV